MPGTAALAFGVALLVAARFGHPLAGDAPPMLAEIQAFESVY